MTYQPPRNGFRTFLIVWVTQSVSVFGSALTFYAITIWLTQVLYPNPAQKPQLALALSAVSLAFAIPVIFGAPIAGAWADRHDRKKTMMVMDVLSGLLSLVLVALIITHLLNLAVLIVLIVAFSITTAFHSSAFDTSYAMLVSEEQLPRANGMMNTMWALSGVLSPVVAALIISLPVMARKGMLGWAGGLLGRLADGTPLTIGIDAVTFFVAAATLLFVEIPSPKRTDLTDESGRVKKSLLSDISEGLLYIWRRQPLLWLLGTFTVANFCGSPTGVFLPLLVKFNLAASWKALGFSFETAFALIGTLSGLGGVLGGILISAWGGLRTKRVYGVIVPLILEGIAIVAFGLSGLYYLSAAMVFVTNLTLPIMNAHSQSIWQAQTPHELQGRVFSVRRLIAQCSGPLSTALAGLAVGTFNPGSVMAALGAVQTLFCVAQLFNPVLMRVEDKVWLDSLAVQTAPGTTPAE